MQRASGDQRQQSRQDGRRTMTPLREVIGEQSPDAPDTLTEKLLPQNVEAEAGVLGSLLIDPEALSLVQEWLRAEDFYRNAHRLVYQAICDLDDAGMGADLLTLIDELQRRGQLEEVGGASYVSSLANQVPTSANVESYARIVERTATLRRLIHAAGTIAGVAYNEPDADVAVDAAEQTLYGVTRARAARTPTVTLSQDMSALVEFVQEGIAAHERGETTALGVSTGYRELDRLLGGGLQRTDLAILAARPRTGKSALMLNMAYAAAGRDARRVLVFSLEMARLQLTQRLAAMASGIDLAKLKAPHTLTDSELASVLETTGQLADLEARLLIDDTRSLTVQQIRSRARQEALRAPLDLIIVDYVQYIAEGPTTRRNDNRTLALGEMTRGLKNLAGELDCAVLGLAQLSRAIETRSDKTPLLSDLRESGSLENDADVVMFLHRDDIYNPDSDRRNIADVIVAKQRNGQEGSVSLYWQGAQQRFRDLELRYVVPDMPRGYDD